MLSLLLRWIVNAGALLLVAYLYPGVHVQDFVAALVAALVLGLVNALIRPILVILTLPVTLLTLGLFLFVFTVTGFWAALVGSILYSLITLVTSWLLFPRRK
jgi:putative membrane protein